MNAGELQFRSSGRPGHHAEVAGAAAHVRARKHVMPVRVRFATAAGTVTTPEGLVHARAGDAIITGPRGEQWRVSAAHFPHKYRAAAPTRAGEDGDYRSLPIEVLARRVPEPFTVLLADGLSRLAGRAGDWLVDYGDGSLGIVAADVFANTYDILG